MRATFIVFFCVVSFYGTASDAQVQFPYELTVAEGRVDVRSGPGKPYYVTGQLSAGDKIQVYRHDSDWLAIRPPEGSFSLVKRDHLKITKQADIAKVTKDDVPCNVGSSMAKTGDYVSWVRLQKDELVEMVDGQKSEIEAAPGDTGHAWQRILPPPGEFRWVNAGDMQKASVARSSTPSAKSSGGDAIRIPTDSQQASGTAKSSEQEAEEPAARTDGDTSDTSGSLDDKWTARRTPLRDSLADIELELSLMVAKDMRAWRLKQLRDRLEATMENLRNEDDRSRARLLLDRVGEFEKLQNRFVQTIGDSDISVPAGTASVANVAATDAIERATGVRYDGSGWLVPVHSTKRTAPPYALLDAEGDVLQYVSPAPGLNLHRYVRKQVGIFGHRGYQASLKKTHVTAERVVDLGRHLR